MVVPSPSTVCPPSVKASPGAGALSCDRAPSLRRLIVTSSERKSIVTTLLSSQRRSEEHTSELQSLMRISYAAFCLKKNTHLEKKQESNMTTRKQIPNAQHMTHDIKTH